MTCDIILLANITTTISRIIGRGGVRKRARVRATQRTENRTSKNTRLYSLTPAKRTKAVVRVTLLTESSSRRSDNSVCSARISLISDKTILIYLGHLHFCDSV